MAAWRAKFETESEYLKNIREQKKERQGYVVDLQHRLHGLNNVSRTYNDKFVEVQQSIDKAKKVNLRKKILNQMFRFSIH